jgi:hypothetical protein
MPITLKIAAPFFASFQSEKGFKLFALPLAMLSVVIGAPAAEILNQSDLPASYALGSNTTGVVWIEASNISTHVTGHFSSTIIGQQIDQNGNPLLTYIAVPNHGFNFPGVVISGIGTGNEQTKDGLIFSNLTMVYSSPLWTPGNTWVNAGDISVWSTTTTVPTNWVHLIAPVGSAQQGSTITSIGYGIPSTPNGLLTYTGNPMGFNSLLSFGVPLNVAANGDYFTGLMGPGLGVYLNGAINNLDSGSVLLNSLGQIVGMAVGFTGGPTDLSRTSVFENWTSPDYYNQIAPYTGIIVTPPTLQFQASGTNLVLTWNGPNALQAATNVVGPYLDVTNAASPYTNSMGAPQEFFRLRSD